MGTAPYIIITNGTTGSGKSGLIDKVIAHYGLPPEHVTFLIDDLIENNPFYKQGIDALIQEECKGHVVCEALKAKVNGLDPSVVEHFGKLYSQTRGKTGEKHCENKTCDDYLMLLLGEAIEKKQNLVFETTGTYYVEWLIRMLRGYKIYYAFTVLDFCDNIHRNQSRAVQDLERYVSGQSQAAPRLPDVGEAHFSEALKALLCNLRELVDKKARGFLPGVHRLVVFDNSDREARVLFDSDRDLSPARVEAALERVQRVVNLRRCPSPPLSSPSPAPPLLQTPEALRQPV